MQRRFHGLFFAFFLSNALFTESFHIPHAKTTTRQKSPVLLRVIDDSRERGQGAKPKSFSFTPFLSPSAKLFESAEISDASTLKTNAAKTPFILYVPFILPIISYITYTPVAAFFRETIDLLSINKNWESVDGGTYQIQILTPTINGVVLPCLGILFATLVSTTIIQLRQRQLVVRTMLNSEASELMVLREIARRMDDVEGADREEGALSCRVLLRKYVSRLLSECRPGVDENARLVDVSSSEGELSTILNRIYQLGFNGSGGGRLTLTQNAVDSIARLNDYRSQRISFMQTTFPPLHYAILALLASSISSCFLLETDQEALVFLNAVQLKILWSMLVGAFTALAVVITDLSDPFKGSYTISSTVLQLFRIRNALNENEGTKEDGNE
ncbi:hypothetical protein TrCOL_g2509 [Triparma columacea]|uniref:MotA/TolQ/ExbB proton channel domain-containing protein n=1 Tax=Triparma columacea TaxID=722753 RepID=A0A9W7GHN4_9STRA|nr:hypothetical protein TrCOL_g2509 [Triparma columacea]